MAKHTLHKTKRDLLGQYFTVNANKVLKNFTNLPKGRVVVDPCAGAGDLLDWARQNGATNCIGYDIEPNGDNIIYNDMFDTPVDCDGKLVITNPPYLSRNRADDKTPFQKWNQSNLYKCYLATLISSNVDEAIIIQPSNFLCESNATARNMLFSHYSIIYAERWQEKIFPDVSIGIMVMHIKRSVSAIQEFDYLNRTTGRLVKMKLNPVNGWLHGDEFFKELPNDFYRFEKVDVGMDSPNSKIVVSLLDKGTYGLGFHFNEKEDIFCKPKSFTTYQINTPKRISKKKQREIVDGANKFLNTYRKKYDSMFIGEYIDFDQRILSRSYVNKILTLHYERI